MKIRYNVSEDEVDAIDRNDWIEKIYYEGDVKVTRFKPVWWKDPEIFKKNRVQR